MVRYELLPEHKHLYKDDMKTKILLPPCSSLLHRFVDILEQDEYRMKLKVYMPEGQIITGWIGKSYYPPLKLVNEEEIYDGRFNA